MHTWALDCSMRPSTPATCGRSRPCCLDDDAERRRRGAAVARRRRAPVDAVPEHVAPVEHAARSTGVPSTVGPQAVNGRRHARADALDVAPATSPTYRGRRYRLGYRWSLVSNLHPGRQVRCSRASLAAPDRRRRVLVEAFVPTWLHRLRDDQYVDAERIERTGSRCVGRTPGRQILDEST